MPDFDEDRKPWLRHYAEYVPPVLPLPIESLIETFERTACASAGRPAIYYLDETVSWAQLDDLATRFAARLAQWGIGHGDRVAVCTQNDPEFPIAVYGSWKLGAIVVPLSPMFRAADFSYHLRDSGARVFVCLDEIYEADAAPGVAGSCVEHVVLSRGLRASLGGDPAPANVRLPVSGDDIAYLVYTSGTTGQPKGAMGLHRNIAFNAEVFRTWMQAGPDDRLLGLAPLFHITGLVASLALSSLSGAPLMLFHRFEAGQALHWTERWQPTMALASITAYIALMNHPSATREGFASLTKCFSGGAPVPPSIVNDFERRFGAYIHNAYGLTESNSPSHMTPMNGRSPVHEASGALSIGVPVPNCEAKVLDLADPDKEMPPGEAGELALKGPMMFAGYWNKPEETVRAFHNGYFLTGDVAVMDHEGWFYLVDRKKDMIVASGFKVWPREVEDVLYEHPAVREAAVVGVPDDYRGETVKAFVALRDGQEGCVTPADLIAFCKQRMAAYKYPRQVEFVPEIPKTATGKFLRRQLRSRQQTTIYNSKYL